MGRRTVRACLEVLSTDHLAPVLEPAGFTVRAKAARWTRTRLGAIQRIEVFAEPPRGSVRGDAIVDPYVDVELPDVNAAALELCGGDASLLADAPELTVRCQFGQVGPARRVLEWIPTGVDQWERVAREIALLAKRHVLPFLAEYSDARGLVKGHERADARLPLNDPMHLIHVAGAYLALGKPARARALIEKSLGHPEWEGEWRAVLKHAARLDPSRRAVRRRRKNA